MTLLVYCSYPVLDQSGEPAWVKRLEDTLTAHDVNIFSLYRPWVPLRAQSHLFPLLESAPHPFFVANAKLLQLEHTALENFGNAAVQDLLSRSDAAAPNNCLPFKDLFCLVRSHIVLSDLSLPSYGETFHDAFFAHLAKVPLIGLTDRFLNSPLMLNMVDTIIPLSKLDVVVEQMVNYSLGYLREETTTKTGDLTTTADMPPENSDHGQTVS